MVTDEAVERVLGVGEVVVIQSCVGWERCVIDALGVGLEVVKVVDAFQMVDTVRFYEGGVFVEACSWELGPHISAAVAGVYALVDGVAFFDGVGVVHELCERIVEVCHLQCFCKQLRSAVALDEVWKE